MPGRERLDAALWWGVQEMLVCLVVVLDSDTLTLRLDWYVVKLLSVRGEVWGTLVNHSVVVWGKAEPWEGLVECSRATLEMTRTN